VRLIRRLFGRSDGQPEHGSAREPPPSPLEAYVIREHRSGRPLDEILDDPYLKNRASDEQRERLLESPAVIRAIGADTAALARERRSA
jgi:hypothetical protein